MKLLLDTCLWGGACAELRAAGHDVLWGGDWNNESRRGEEYRLAATL
jgi:hypothetical protein